MASYNAYIGTIAKEKDVFSGNLQEMEFFSKYLEVVAEMESDFAQKIKARSRCNVVVT